MPAGRVTSAIASNLDLLPTLAAMANAALPDAELDGRDLSAVILNDGPSPHEEIILFDNANIAGVRAGRWKYVVRSYYRIYDAPLDRYPLLFDLESDPAETYSVAALHPDVAVDMAARVARARARFDPIAAAFPPHTAPASAKRHPD